MKAPLKSIAFVAASIFVSAATLCAATDVSIAAARLTPSGIGLKSAMRMLWDEHLVYTRNYIIIALADLPGSDSIAKQLPRSKDGTGGAIKPYHAEPAGLKLTALLKDHILIATEVVKAAKAGSTEQLRAAQTKWLANGKEIAAFLNTASPNWPKKTLENMLEEHLVRTTGEVVARLKRDWYADIQSYELGHMHMILFADVLAEGIAKQFPDKFKD